MTADSTASLAPGKAPNWAPRRRQGHDRPPTQQRRGPVRRHRRLARRRPWRTAVKSQSLLKKGKRQEQPASLQRLKSQGLWWRVEGQSRLAEESVDEAGPTLDGPEPGADYGLELVEGGGGVVAQAAFHR